jgi:hypothetical protein
MKSKSTVIVIFTIQLLIIAGLIFYTFLVRRDAERATIIALKSQLESEKQRRIASENERLAKKELKEAQKLIDELQKKVKN